MTHVLWGSQISVLEVQLERIGEVALDTGGERHVDQDKGPG